MKTVRKAILGALVPFVCAVGVAHAQGQGQGIGHNGSYGPSWDRPATSSMDRLAPQQRDAVARIEGEMMQLTMDHHQVVAKTDIDYAQAKMQLQQQLQEIYRGH